MLASLGRNTKVIRKLRNITTEYGKTLCVGVQIVRNQSTVDVASNDYQYIKHAGIKPTLYFQDSLTHLSVPTLKETLTRYLKAQEPILTTSQFENTKKYAEKFEKEEGALLQKKLLEWDREHQYGNYVSPYWFDMYLSDRTPLPINYNPMLVVAMEENPMYNTQLVKATNVVVSSLRFMTALRDNVLDPEVYFLTSFGISRKMYDMMTPIVPVKLRSMFSSALMAFPFDMSQYHNLFCTTRIPCIGKDRIYEDTSARHIVVMRKGHFYAFNVLDENQMIISPKEIASNLKAILNDNTPANAVPIGVLTTSERDAWAKMRIKLEDMGNQEVLRCIDSAIILLNLDDDVMEDNYGKLLRNYLHADGTNRWFDKSLSIIVTKDGHTGINFEHSWGDGVAVLRFAKNVKADISKNPHFHPHDVEELTDGSNMKKLEFNVDNEIKEMVRLERKKFDDWRNSLDVNYLIYDGFGSKECKKFKISPDAIMQLGFQLAMYNLTQKFVPTYESCTTATFKHGRTETIRPCTMQSKAACIALSAKDKTSMPELKQLINEASKTHGLLVKEAFLGRGFDRHLFVLRKLAEQTYKGPNSSLPELFTDPAYAYINKNILSTSTLSDPTIIAGGFGPTEKDGYGIGYMIQYHKLGTVVTTYRKDHSAADFVQSLNEAFRCIHKVLQHAS